MGPTLHERKPCPIYEDAIFCIAQGDEDGVLQPHPSKGARTQTSQGTSARKPAGRGVSQVHGSHVPRPPTKAAQKKLCIRREKQQEEQLAQNEEEQAAHDIEVFFPESDSSLMDADNYVPW